MYQVERTLGSQDQQQQTESWQLACLLTYLKGKSGVLKVAA